MSLNAQYQLCAFRVAQLWTKWMTLSHDLRFSNIVTKRQMRKLQRVIIIDLNCIAGSFCLYHCSHSRIYDFKVAWDWPCTLTITANTFAITQII